MVCSVHSIMIRTRNGLFDYDFEDCIIRNHMVNGHVFEDHIINDMLRPYIEKSKYIVDVGANIGCHAISYAGFNPECKIWAFEPQEKLHTILTRNVKHNNLEDRINVYKHGLGHRDMVCELDPMDRVEMPQYSGWNKGGMGIGSGGEQMNVTTLDSFNLPGLDFIKIDVEGAEGLVIAGGRETILKYKPIVCFEHNYRLTNPDHVGLTIEEVGTGFQGLTALGYRRFEYLDCDNYLAFKE